MEEYPSSKTLLHICETYKTVRRQKGGRRERKTPNPERPENKLTGRVCRAAVAARDGARAGGADLLAYLRLQLGPLWPPRGARLMGGAATAANQTAPPPGDRQIGEGAGPGPAAVMRAGGWRRSRQPRPLARPPSLGASRGSALTTRLRLPPSPAAEHLIPLAARLLAPPLLFLAFYFLPQGAPEDRASGARDPPLSVSTSLRFAVAMEIRARAWSRMPSSQTARLTSPCVSLHAFS